MCTKTSLVLKVEKLKTISTVDHYVKGQYWVLGKEMFWFANSFLSKLTVKDWKLLGQKKPFSRPCPQFLMKSPINMDDNLPYFQKISAPFFDLGEISRFDSFLTVFWRSKNCQNKISPLNQKSTQRFFENMEDYHPYLLRISSKIGGNWGKMVFFGLEVFNLRRSVLTRKSWRIKKFLFLKLNTSLWHNDPQ